MTNEWKLIDWDGNRALGYKCYRKKFRRGHVSVGVGEFKSVVYSYGPSSDDSIGGTRWRSNGEQTPEQAMEMIDRNKGLHNHLDKGSHEVSACPNQST